MGEEKSQHLWEVLLLILFSVFSVALVGLRIHLSGSNFYRGIVWNLFLAWIPYLLSLFMRFTGRKIHWSLILLFFVPLWLLFFPNSFYIITDLFHLEKRPSIPLWYDLMLIVSFAWTGAMLGFLSLTDVQELVSARLGRATGWVFALLVLLLGSYGVYLGRFKRWNSWDIVTKPVSLLSDVVNELLHPSFRSAGSTIIYAIFLILAYLMLRLMMKRKHFTA